MILITGGKGFIGLHLARYLADRGQEVLLLDLRRIEPPSFLAPFWDNQVKGVSGDILDLPNLFNLIKEHSVESIIHAAAIWEGGGNLYQVLRIDLEGTANVLEAARIFGLRRVTFFSSVAVYLGSKAGLFSEDIDLPAPSTRYIPAVKKAGEQICLLYAKEYGLSVPMLRLSRVYGALGHVEINPIEIMVRNAVAHKPADLSHLWGGTMDNFVYVADVAKGIALVHLAKALKHDIYNVGDSTEHSLLEIAQAVKEVIPEAEIRFRTAKTERDITQGHLDITRMKEEMGYVPDYDLKQGIRSHINWVRDGKYE